MTAPLETKHPIRELLAIAAPSVATMTSYTLMQFVDGFMVSRVEPSSLSVSAQGNGGICAWAPMSLAMGLFGVINTYVSQNIGAGRHLRAPAYVWNGLWIAVAYWLLLIPYALFLPRLYALQGHAPELIAVESAYGQTLLFGGVLTLCSRALSQAFYGLHRPRIVLYAALTANVLNLGLNWVLVYGHLGVPAMGVRGSAVSTVLATAVEISIPLSIFLGPRMHAIYATRGSWKPSWPHIKDLLRTGWSPAFMFGNEMICWAIFMSALVGQFGPQQNAASWAVLRYMQLSFMPAVGISFAINAIVGKCLGANRPDLAHQRAWLGIRLAMGYMFLCAAAMLLFRHQLVSVFIGPDTTPADRATIIAIGGNIMIVAALFQAFDGLGITIIGALRGSGDTVVPSIVTMVLAWTCILGLGWALASMYPQWGAVGPWIGSAVYIFALGVFLFFRFHSGKWKTLKLLEHSATPH